MDILARRTRKMIEHHRRRAKEAGAALNYGLADLRELVRAALEGPCPFCRKPLSVRSFGIDHATPTSRGGDHALANLRVVCMPCNETKGALTEAEFEALRALLAAWPEDARRATLACLRAGGRLRR